jgi:hypothetical protein
MSPHPAGQAVHVLAYFTGTPGVISSGGTRYGIAYRTGAR